MDLKEGLLSNWGIGLDQEAFNNDSHVLSGEEELRMLVMERKASKDNQKQKRAGRKPAVGQEGRVRRTITTSLYGDNYEYLLARAKNLGIESGQITAVINFLIDEDRRNHKDILIKDSKRNKQKA